MSRDGLLLLMLSNTRGLIRSRLMRVRNSSQQATGVPLYRCASQQVFKKADVKTRSNPRGVFPEVEMNGVRRQSTIKHVVLAFVRRPSVLWMALLCWGEVAFFRRGNLPEMFRRKPISRRLLVWGESEQLRREFYLVGKF